MKIIFDDASKLAKTVQRERKRQKVSQIRLSQLANVGVRFIRDLEDGKKTVQLDKVLSVLETLGVAIELTTMDGNE